MPSTSITLALCFFAFICGQLFNAFCTSLHPVKIEYITNVVSVDTGFSLKTLIAVVLSVMVVHDVAILLVILQFLKSPNPTTTKALRVLKTLSAAAADCIVIRQRPRLLLSPLLVNISPAMHIGFLRKPMGIAIPRPFWLWQVLYRPSIMTFGSRVHLSLIEYPTALALVTKRVSSPLSCISLFAGGRPGMQDTLPTFIRPFGPMAAPAVPRYPLTGVGLQGIWGAIIKEEGEENSEDSTLFLESNSSFKEEPIEKALAEDSPVHARQSHVPFLRNLAAAALLRKLHVQVDEEPCYASIEEVAEDENDIEESAEDFQVEKVVEAAEKDIKNGMETLFFDAVSESNGFDLDEKKIDIVTGDHESVAPLYEEFEGLPSYEEFAQGAPAEPLFDTSASPIHGSSTCHSFTFLFLPSTHAAVHRPPPLSTLAVHMGVKCTNIHPRASRLPLLARLSSRVSAPTSESV